MPASSCPVTQVVPIAATLKWLVAKTDWIVNAALPSFCNCVVCAALVAPTAVFAKRIHTPLSCRLVWTQGGMISISWRGAFLS